MGDVLGMLPRVMAEVDGAHTRTEGHVSSLALPPCSLLAVTATGEWTLGRARAAAEWELRTLLGKYPGIALPLMYLRRRPGEFLTPVTAENEIVIDGFPRSGNTFAVAAFHLAQSRDVSIAHHSHVPAQLIEAVRRRIPAIALVRDPRGAALSFGVRAPHLSLGQILRSYVRFHEPLLRIRGSLVVATFEQATGDLGRVIARVNERFGTGFVPFAHTPENVALVKEQIERGDLHTFGDVEGAGRGGGLPSDERERMKDGLRQEYDRPRLAGLRERAGRAYRVLAGLG